MYQVTWFFFKFLAKTLKYIFLLLQILMTSRYPFKLGSKVFQLLLDIFLYHDFSVLNFIKGLQVGWMVIVPQLFLILSCDLVCCCIWFTVKLEVNILVISSITWMNGLNHKQINAHWSSQVITASFYKY